MLLMFARLLAGFTLVPEGTFLDGLDYLPPWPFVLLVVPCVLACCVVRQRRLALLLGTTFLMLLAVDEDLSWRHRGVSGQSAPVLKVATLNVQYYRHGHQRVVDAIKSMDADVILLSENEVSPKTLPQLQALFAPLHFYPGRSQECAIVSRVALQQVKEVELPSFQASLKRRNRLGDQSSHPHRSFLHGQLDLNGSTIHIISIRFIAGRPPSDRFADQLAWGRYLVNTHHDEGRFFVNYLSGLEGPIVFGGDLNAPPSARLIGRLNAVAQDAYLATHWWGRPTFQRDLPVLRLDYLFGMNGAIPIEADRLAHEVSDHFPVLAHFALPLSRSSRSQAVRGALTTP
jgi:endonuclease/exonuclease/phosphatase (EEP) superfamily protein YafD